ncbi:UPF0182 family protein [Candidatus Woesearchaeota archaeon]|jgi:uncharacterized protein|nr:UPF0182 family protein [Candidatus Woesearchaeota archaeon]MBT6519886.1 UPF0182 family protein [Candidatus Woesearchaeota archaeon]MBT7367178.1 UPF0182 family protein [Candidatus Woesearchaeota archaeon]
MTTIPQNNKTSWIKNIIIIVFVLIFIGIFALAGLITDFYWFDALGFANIFTISLSTKILTFAVAAVSFFIFLFINLAISSKINTLKKQKEVLSLKFKSLIALVISIFVGFTATSAWFTILKYLNRTSFNIADPIFAKDVSFYVFTLPFYSAIWTFVFATVFVTLILVILDYVKSIISNKLQTTIDPVKAANDPFGLKTAFSLLKNHAAIHLSVLAAMIFTLLAARHYLSFFSIMFSEQGIVVGAGYADVVAYLPILKILAIVALIVAALFLVWTFVIAKQPNLKKRHIIFYALFIYILFLFVGPTIIPGVIQSFKVSPNEINLEKPFIENNIEFTRIAYGLENVEESEFEVAKSITPELLEASPETMDNIRILDWRPLTKTYKQTQEIRLYYDLSGIDIDRYNIDGKYTQVMLAPRELEQTQITPNAQTWVNIHMVYTHGFGVVMSPVNKVTSQGLPEYLIKDIPPIYAVDEPLLKIDQPQIYYGEKYGSFVLTNTNTNEFDYPKGNSNEYLRYDGKGGVTLNSFWKKVLMAIRFADIKILLSEDITPESKVMFNRQIQERISKITPFLSLDADPYLVINEGKLYWIQDAYTSTGNFPYSAKYGGINYIRNSVKVVVNAYDGDVSFYVVDKKDPLMQTYAKVFPKQFKSFDQMPEGLKSHLRYPEDLFKIQSQIYSTYHMDDATVFYNKEDAWQIPYEVYGVGQQTVVEPYYMVMNLPDETEEEFVLMTSFTPIKKDNMIAWMAARSDGDNYGKLLLYKFPKDKLVYGPLQIEAKIDQDSEISQQLTLWSQQGSRVTRGNLLVIPIQDSLLYIEPLYIQAETGQLPELKRVLISDGERVVMEVDLGTALESLFGKSKTPKPIEYNDEGIEILQTDADLINEANQYYTDLLTSMTNNDWVSFGENFDNLGKVLDELNSEE